MKSIPEMIELLRNNPAIVGLMEYGSASYLDETIEGDYDLVAVVGRQVSEVESLHFYVDETPVDLNIRTVQQIDLMDRADGFDSILLDVRIIHDPSGRVMRTLGGLRKRHHSNPVPRIRNDRIADKRHGAKHTFDKVRRGRDLPLTLKRYLFHQCVYWALIEFFEIRGLQYRGEKHGLAFLQQNEPDLFHMFEEFYGTTDPCEQARLARLIEEAVLDPLGGMWQDGEMLAFGDQEKGEEIFRVLFGRCWVGQPPRLPDGRCSHAAARFPDDRPARKRS